MASTGKTVSTPAPSKGETAGARAYVGSTAKANPGTARVQEKVGSDASNVNYYKGISSYKSEHPGTKYNKYDQMKYDSTIRSAVDRDREIGKLNEAYDYLNSGSTNTQSTSEWMDIANERAQNATDEDVRSYWSRLANDLDGQFYADNRASYSSANEELAKLKEEEATLKQNRKNAGRVTAGMIPDVNSLTRSKEANDAWIANQNRQKELAALISGLDSELIDILATPEEKEALEAYKKNDYGNINKLILGDAVGRPDFLGERKDKVTGNGRDKAADYALIQGLYDRLGMEVPLLNNQEIWANEIGGRVESWVGSIASVAASSEANANNAADIVLGDKKADGWDIAHMVANGGHSIVQGLTAKFRDKLTGADAPKQIGGLNAPVTGEIESLWDAYNKAPVTLEGGEKDEILQTLMAGAASWNKNADALQKQYDANAARIEEIAKMTDITDPAMVAELNRETNELGLKNHQLSRDIQDARTIAGKYAGDSPSYWWALKNGTAEDRAAAIHQLAWKLDNEGKQKYSSSEAAANGPIQKRVLQTVGSLTEMGLDAAVQAITGIDSKFILGLRVAGGSRNEGLSRGYSESKASLFAGAKATAEVAAEGMFEMAGGAIYGKAFYGDFAGELARTLSDNPIFRKWFIKALSPVGEAIEEGATDIAGIPIEMIFDYNKDQSFWQNLYGKSAQELANIWDDMLSGALVALAGIPIGDITGSYNEQVGDTYRADIASDIEAVDRIATEKANAPRVGFADTVAAARGESNEATQQAVKDHFLDQAEQEHAPQETSVTKAAKKYRDIINKYSVKDEAGNIIGLKDIPENERLTKKESDMLQASGLMPKEVKALFTGATEKEKAKADKVSGKSKDKAKRTEEKFIGRAKDLGVGQREAKPGEFEVREEETPEHEPNAGGSREYEAIVAAEAAKGQQAIEDGETDNKKLAEVVPVVDSTIKMGKTIKSIRNNIFKKTGKEGEPSLLDKVVNWMEKQVGGSVYTKKIGGENGADIILNRRGIKNDIAHGVGEEKAAAFQAVPDVLRNGTLVSITKENGEPVSYIIAGKINLLGKPVNVYCVVKRDGAGSNRFYLHEVSDGNGNLLYQLNDDGDVKGQQESAPSTLQDPSSIQTQSAEETLSEDSIPQEAAGMQEKTEESTSEPESGIIKEARWDDPGVINTNFLEDSDIQEYVSQARDGKLIYLESREGNQYFYDGENLYALDEDGNAISFKPISKEKVASMIADYAQNYGLISLENHHIEFAKGVAENDTVGQDYETMDGTSLLRNETGGEPFIGDTPGYEPGCPPFDGAGKERLKLTHWMITQRFSENGGQVVPRDSWTPFEQRVESFIKKLGVPYLTIIDGSNYDGDVLGSAYKDEPGIGIFVVRGKTPASMLARSRNKTAILAAQRKFLRTALHESFHNRLAARIKNSAEVDVPALLEETIREAGISKDVYDKAFKYIKDLYAPDYLGAPENFNDKSFPQKDRDDFFAALTPKQLEDYEKRCKEEMLCFMFGGQLGELYHERVGSSYTTRKYGEAVKYLRQRASELGMFSQDAPKEITDGLGGEQYDYAESLALDFSKELSVPVANAESISEVDQLKAENEDLKRQLAELQGKQEQPTQVRPDIQVPGTKTQHKPNALEQKTQSYGARVDHATRMDAIAEKFGTDDGTFISKTREEVSRIAKYCIEKFGMENEYDRLLNAKNWTRLDFSEAGKIVYDMTVQLNRDMAANGNSGLGKLLERLSGESNYEYGRRQAEEDKRAYKERREQIDALLQAYEEQKSEAGQKLQEQHKFTIADEIRMRASQRFLSYTLDGEVRNNSDEQISVKMWNIIDDLLDRAEKADTAGDLNEMKEIAKLTAQIRGRQNLFGKAGVKAENAIFDDLMKHGLDKDQLASLTYGNISKIMDDITPITYMDALNTIRMSNMLSNVATGINNIKNNAVALRLGALAQNAAYPFAKAFEKITGKKVAFTDSSFFRFGGGKGRAELTAYEYALLSAYYGINQEQGRFDVRGANAGFNINLDGVGGVMGRNLARYNFLINALVLSPDAPAKARAEHAMRQGIERAFEGVNMTKEMAANKKELEAYAHNETLRRTLQDDNRLTNDVMWVKNRLNKHETRGKDIVINGRKLGSLKLGDFAIAFAKVPANVGYQKAMATPFGAFWQIANDRGRRSRGHDGCAEELR